MEFCGMKRKIDRKCLNHARVHANAQSFDRCEVCVHFVTCPKQGLEMEAVVLHRVRCLAHFCPKQGEDFKPSGHPYTQTWVKYPPPPPPGHNSHKQYIPTRTRDYKT